MATKTELEDEVIKLTKERDDALDELRSITALISNDESTQAIIDMKIQSLNESLNQINKRVSQFADIPIQENERTALRHHYNHEKERIEQLRSKLQGEMK